jgi:nucleoside-diphosphate-sugar epimerase
LLTGKKILVTGPAGRIAFGLCRELAKSNEVWGAARYSDPASRARVEGIGVKAVKVDLGSGVFADLPDDFDYLLHLAASIGPGLDYDGAIRVNAEGTGLLLAHCRKAKAALVMSSTSVYKPNPDPWHPYAETDPVGDANVPGTPTYGITKLIEEGVARTMARHLNLPVVIARMDVSYGPTEGSLPRAHLEMIRAGQTVRLRSDPAPYRPLHDRDLFDQLPAMLGLASVPATVVNWCGDELVTAQEWCQYFADLLGVTPTIVVEAAPGSRPGSVSDITKRLAATGPSRVHWRDGFREMVETPMG